ncbi:MAG: hypothetical protein J0I99_13400 [Devosia sp.]|uniref:hypothetical protein n=1 Tax=Devosia sp. TaxID=1871048 RepID=UPI001ACB2BAB|nr:hypothetical protein [Devosia sp.]MBN9316731.1 hypothetical protein [Devosia sp.]
MRSVLMLLVAALLVLSVEAQAQDGPPATNQMTFGGDHFIAGQSALVDTPVARDVFAAGYDVALRAPVSGDAHLAGFNVSQGADVVGDLYAAGYSVSVTGNVGGDVTAMGNSVSVTSAQPVGGNVRIAGQTVTLSSGIDGAALVTAQTLTLGGAVKGDLNFVGENLNFGPDARVDGTVTIHAPRQIAVPASVASADRVKFEQLVTPDYSAEAGKTAEHVIRGVWPAVWATGIWWLLLFVVGVVFIALLPRLTQALESAARAHPFRRLGLGFVTLAAVIGLVPVLVMTFVGIFLVPFAVLFVVIVWALAYLAGAYLLGAGIARGLVTLETNLRRIVVLALSIVVAGLLGMIPVIGWLLTLVILCFGFGVVASVILGRFRPRDQQPAPAAIPPAPEAV